jgi:hypothetical protein
MTLIEVVSLGFLRSWQPAVRGSGFTRDHA